MDDKIPEVIIASGKSCCVYDANNANEITSYKDDNPFVPKTLALMGEDYLIGAYANKPMVRVWTLSKKKKQEQGNFVVPGQVSALTVSNCGQYCVAGIKSQIYVWDVTTGDVMNILCRHYQPVTCLKFTADDSRFFSGGQDGHVIVWVLSHVIDVSTRHDTVKPNRVWNNHSAEVTDIYCGNSVSRVATTSLDMTCKVYELDSGILLSSICMDVPLTCVVMDPLEYYIFLGDERGCLYRINTYERFPHEIHRADMNNKAALMLHDTKIISLGISFDGTRIMTASEDRTIKFWDIQSMACSLNIHVEGPLTNVILAIKPVSLSNEEIVPMFKIRMFEKDITPLNENKKYTESDICRKELSLFYDGCPDKFFCNSFYSMGSKVKAEEMDAKAVEETFEMAIHGETISQVTRTNQQLYSFNYNKTLEDLFGGPPSPS